MPNRGELVISPARRHDCVAGPADAWTVASICTAGWAVSAFLTAHFVSFGDVTALIAQIPWG